VSHPSWRDAWHAALYAPGGFFARGERPAGHFRTSALVGPELAEALVEMLARIDHALGGPPRLDVVDMGAGGGELAGMMRELAGAQLGRRLHVTAVELVPPAPMEGVRWSPSLPDEMVGLLIGHEWLDSVPCEVMMVREARTVRVHVDRAGNEYPGDVVSCRWQRRWWPLCSEGDRAEVGESRDVAWAAAVSRVRAGAALAIDYGHTRADRPRHGTLTGYRRGRQVPPVPDGSCDLTAHVAFDSCALAAPTDGTVLTTQRAALAALGLPSGAPAAALAASDPLGWLATTARVGRVAELRDPAGLGGYGWLLQTTAGLSPRGLLSCGLPSVT